MHKLTVSATRFLLQMPFKVDTKRFQTLVFSITVLRLSKNGLLLLVASSLVRVVIEEKVQSVAAVLRVCGPSLSDPST